MFGVNALKPTTVRGVRSNAEEEQVGRHVHLRGHAEREHKRADDAWEEHPRRELACNHSDTNLNMFAREIPHLSLSATHNCQ